MWTEHTITALSMWWQQGCQDHQAEAHASDCMPASCSGQLRWLSAETALETAACLLRWLAILLQMASHHLLQWRALCRE